MHSVELKDRQLLIDGKNTQLIAGVFHYFRTPGALWRDRLEKAVACGLNAIETYICWNLHEPSPGKFNFSGELDFEEYIRIAGELGLYVILRPGPYICSEWDNGGIPSWLLKNRDLRIRSFNPAWMDAVRNYFAELLPRIRKYEYDNGGPVIAMQIENEYGSYGRDKKYLCALRDLYINAGCKSVLFTLDGAENLMANGGTIPGVWSTFSFGSSCAENLINMRPYNPEGPDSCMEFWHGWFDHWGEEHHTRDAENAAKELDDMLKMGASVNMYSFAGGTNFGFNNGANCLPGGVFAPTCTSYDFNAPVSESGDITPKFHAFQEVIKKYRPDAKFSTPSNPEKICIPQVLFSGSADLLEQLDNLSTPFECNLPETMEFFNQPFGFIYYKTRLHGPVTGTLNIYGLHDRAHIFRDGECIAVMDRNDEFNRIENFEIPSGGCDLEVLVENMGRINYGPLAGTDRKGIDGNICIDRQIQNEFIIRPLPLDDLSRLQFGKFKNIKDRPAFHLAEFELEKTADTFIKFPGIKGNIFINGFNLGRYWNTGPAQTLYLPGCLLKKGKNTIIVFELHELNNSCIAFSTEPFLG